MIRNILTQIWNQRRSNGWIFFELMVASVFLWMVIEPLYMITANRLIPQNQELEPVYFLRLQMREENHPAYQADQPDTIHVQVYEQGASLLRSLPETEAVCLARRESYPESNTSRTSNFWAQNDTTGISNWKNGVMTQFWGYVAGIGDDIFRIYGMKDAVTGGEVRRSQAPSDNCYISEHLAQRLFKKSDAMGEKIVDGRFEASEVLGVYKDFKENDFLQPYPSIVFEYSKLEYDDKYNQWRFIFLLRLKDGVDKKAFEKRFNEEIKAQLAMGNYYVAEFYNLEEYVALKEQTNDNQSTITLMEMLTVFGILCVFLGMVGTFWLRCRARRSEIGLMRSLGASRRNILVRLLTEAALLASVAFAVVLPFIYLYAATNGMTELDTLAIQYNFLWMGYPQNRFWPHFLTASVLAYAVMIVTALIGTWIPARQAATVSPAEALAQGE